jgi:hypothetical protein
MLPDPLHHHAIGVLSPISLTCFLFAAKWGEAYQLISCIFRVTPQADLVQVSLIVHEYQSQNEGIKIWRAVCESDRLSRIDGRGPPQSEIRLRFRSIT